MTFHFNLSSSLPCATIEAGFILNREQAAFASFILLEVVLSYFRTLLRCVCKVFSSYRILYKIEVAMHIGKSRSVLMWVESNNRLQLKLLPAFTSILQNQTLEYFKFHIHSMHTLRQENANLLWACIQRLEILILCHIATLFYSGINSYSTAFCCSKYASHIRSSYWLWDKYLSL